MDLKRLVTQFAYEIEPKPEGGFIAHATDPAIPPLEASTREELQHMIQQKVFSALAAEFPQLRPSADGKTRELQFHIDHTPDGETSIQAADPNTPATPASSQNDLENYLLEKVLNFAGKRMTPELSKALAAQVGSAKIKVVINGKTTFDLNSGSQGLSFGTPQISQTSSTAEPPSVFTPSSSSQLIGGTIGNAAINPESSNSGKVFGLLLLFLILGCVVYFFLR